MISNLNAASIVSTHSMSLNRSTLCLSSTMHYCVCQKANKMSFLSVEVERHLEILSKSSSRRKKIIYKLKIHKRAQTQTRHEQCQKKNIEKKLILIQFIIFSETSLFSIFKIFFLHFWVITSSKTFSSQSILSIMRFIIFIMMYFSQSEEDFYTFQRLSVVTFILLDFQLRGEWTYSWSSQNANEKARSLSKRTSSNLTSKPERSRFDKVKADILLNV
jgi:hypothetical protein